MTHLWHCTPKEFDEQPEDMIQLHIAIYSAEKRQEYIDEKRGEQRAKLSK